MVNAGRNFEREMQVLRANVLAAFESGRVADLARGLSVYESVYQHLLYRGADWQRVSFGQPASQPQLSWLVRDLELFSQASARAGVEARDQLLSFLFSLANQAYRRSNVEAVGVFLRPFSSVWRGVINSPTAERADVEHVLVLMQNFATFTVATSTADESDSLAVAEICSEIFAEMARIAIDGSHSAAFERVIGYLAGLHQYPRARWEHSAARFRDSCLLAVLAYILLLADKEGPTSDGTLALPVLADTLLSSAEASILQNLAIADLPLSTSLAQDPAGGRTWRHWETRFALPMTAYTLRFDSYIDRAAARVAAGHRSHWRVNTSESYRWARRVLTYVPSDALDLRLALNRSIAAWEGDEQKRLASAALEQSRVSDFRAALADRFSHSIRLLDSFLTQEAPTSKVESDRQLLFINFAAPKDFFVETDVIALPQSLADGMVQALLRAEERWLLEKVVGEPSIEATPAESIERATEFVTDYWTSANEPLIVVFNSVIVHQRLEAHLAQSKPKGSVQLLYTEEESVRVLGVDLVTSRRVLAEAEEKPGLERIADTTTSVGIFDEGGSDDRGQPVVRIESGEWLTWLSAASTEVLLLTLPDELNLW